MSIKTIAVASPPHRPASASLRFSRESYGQWLYLARRSSTPRPRVQTPPSDKAAQPRARTKREPAVRYFD